MEGPPVSVDIHRVDARGVIRLYLEQRARYASVPSLAGREPDVPRSTAPPSGFWESLLGLMRGVPDWAVRCLHLEHFGTAGPQWQPVVLLPDDTPTVDSWVKANDAAPLMLSEQVAVKLSHGQIAAVVGMTREEVTRAIQAAVAQVQDNLAELRVRSRAQGGDQ